MAVPGRLELPTFGLGNRCSIRLSYGTSSGAGVFRYSIRDLTGYSIAAKVRTWAAGMTNPRSHARATGWAIAAAVMTFGCGPMLAQPSALPCGSAEIARGQAISVIDGRTFVLDDGREVRL